MSAPSTRTDPEKSVPYRRALKRKPPERPPPPAKEIVVYMVNEVYICIPVEHSAAGFELKIAGSVKIADKVCWCALIRM